MLCWHTTTLLGATVLLIVWRIDTIPINPKTKRDRYKAELWSTLQVLQSRFGDKPREIWLFCSQKWDCSPRRVNVEDFVRYMSARETQGMRGDGERAEYTIGTIHPKVRYVGVSSFFRYDTQH